MADSIVDGESEESFLPGCKDPSSYSQEALRAILTAIKSANDLPSQADKFEYYTSYPGVRKMLKAKGESILNLMSALVQNHAVRETFGGRELEEKYDLLVDVNDVILESASNYLDEAEGVGKAEEELVLAVKPPGAINTSWNKKRFSTPSDQSFKLLTAKNITRPQLSFKDKIDNTNSIFVPIITEKPNSIKPLAIILEGDKEEFCHPYEWEIEKFSPSEDLLNEVEPRLPKSVEETPLIMVKTVRDLNALCVDLMNQTEVAVDLEHHSYRSFQGFTCLMQISTREKDYIVDTLLLRSELHKLNDVFTNPKIVKVLHGADMDVIWLQRDFGLYVVNLFDTGQAARVMHLAHLSLSYLLKHYCKLEVDKRFQLADWRIRPLPEEMVKYAREDTHYLLYVYDCLKNDLIKSGNELKNLLVSTFERSKVICAKKYQKPLFSEDKYLDLYKKSRKMLNAKQLYCVKELFSWRDRIARENDESIAYVLPNHMLLQIAEALPREQQGILACCNPIPPLVKQQLNELHSIILKTNDSSIKQLELLELQQKAQAPKANNTIDLSSLVHCPHDVHHLEDKVQSANDSQSENLLPLPSHSSPHQSSVSLLNKKPIMSALFSRNMKKGKDAISVERKIPEKVIDFVSQLIGPYRRYKITEELQLFEKKPSKENHSEQTVDEAASTDNHMMNDTTERIKVVAEMVSESPASTSNFVMESTPLRKKGKKKRKNKIEPDISIIVPPAKKQRTPEVVIIDEDNFTPYDYQQADYSKFSGSNEKQKGKNNEQKQGGFQTPRSYYGKKRKHVKQATFSKAASQGKSNSSKWPQNK